MNEFLFGMAVAGFPLLFILLLLNHSYANLRSSYRSLINRRTNERMVVAVAASSITRYLRANVNFRGPDGRLMNKGEIPEELKAMVDRTRL